MLDTPEDVAQLDSFLGRALEVMGHLGLLVNLAKTALLLKVRGPGARRALKPYIVQRKGRKHWRISSAKGEALIPLATSVVYLGTHLTLEGGGKAVAQHRLGEARDREAKIKRTVQARRLLGLQHRIRIWQTCSNRQPWHDQHADSSQPGMAPTVRGGRGDNDIEGHPMGSSSTRMASQAHQNREGHQALQTAETANWISRTPLQCGTRSRRRPCHQAWTNLSHEQATQAVANLLRNTAKDGIMHRLQSLKPLRPDLQADVVVMLLTLTIRQHAAEVYRDLDLLANNCVGKVIGLWLRKERVNKTSLAKELEKLQL